MHLLFKEGLRGCPKKTSQCKAFLVQAGGLASMWLLSGYLVATSIFWFLFYSFYVPFLLSPCMLFSVALTLLYPFLFSFCMLFSIFCWLQKDKEYRGKKRGRVGRGWTRWNISWGGGKRGGGGKSKGARNWWKRGRARGGRERRSGRNQGLRARWKSSRGSSWGRERGWQVKHF